MLLSLMKQSDEYRTMGAIDIGRFLMLTLGSSRHYYALTGTAPRFSAAYSHHEFPNRPVAIVTSSVSRGHRLIDISRVRAFADIAFAAYEGSGSLSDSTFKKHDFEFIDFMPNGQLRFAIYDDNDLPAVAADPALTAAGKPAKCLWCHEIRLQRRLRPSAAVEGFANPAALDLAVSTRMATVQQYRSGLVSRIDYSHTQDHTYAELLYLSFMEPSVERLAREWNLPVTDTAARLRGRGTHRQGEFAYLGDHLYRRAEIDDDGPYPTIRVPEDARELSAYEPDLLH
jgi:hypothetical protein